MSIEQLSEAASPEPMSNPMSAFVLSRRVVALGVAWAVITAYHFEDRSSLYTYGRELGIDWTRGGVLVSQQVANVSWFVILYAIIRQPKVERTGAWAILGVAFVLLKVWIWVRGKDLEGLPDASRKYLLALIDSLPTTIFEFLLAVLGIIIVFAIGEIIRWCGRLKSARATSL